MVLGGGGCQQNLIKRAKEEGHYVVVADYLESPPACRFADEHVRVSTFDTPAVLKAARELKIDGITTLGTDQPVLTAAVVSKELGLNYYADPELALAVTNKRVMKEVFNKHNIPSCDYRLIGEGFSDEEIEGLSFPAVLKPVDSQGQRGIFLVNNADEARRHIAETLSYSREEKVLLEEFYRSDEITVNGWAADGSAKIISVVDRVTMRGTNRIGICLCHNFPSVHLEKYNEEIERITDDIVDAFGIEEGPIYFQYLIGEEGIKVNEIAMRIGGAYEDITLPIISEIDVASMLMQYAKNGSCDTEALSRYNLSENNKFLSTQLFFLKPGSIMQATPEQEILNLKGVKDVYYSVCEGDKIGGIENATARAGYFIVEGNSFSDMINNVDTVFNSMQFLNQDGENLVIKYSDYKDKYLFYQAEE